MVAFAGKMKSQCSFSSSRISFWDPYFRTHTHSFLRHRRTLGLTLLLLIFGDWDWLIDWFSFQRIYLFDWWSFSLVSKYRTQQCCIFYILYALSFSRDFCDSAFLCCRAQMYTTLNKHYAMLFWGSKGLADCCSADWLLLELLCSASGLQNILARAFDSRTLDGTIGKGRTGTNPIGKSKGNDWEESHPRARTLSPALSRIQRSQLGEF